MSQFLQPTILLLTEGTEVSQGKSQIISNINACASIVELVRTTLGPRGTDKLIKNAKETTITNDGATILNLLEIVHPAARLLVDIAKAQDNEVGDGTTSVVLLTGEILKEAKGFIDDSMNPQSIIKGLREGLSHALLKLEEISMPVSEKDSQERRQMLLNCAKTAMNSKMIAHYQDHFAELVVSAVEKLDPETMDKEMIGVKLVTGGSILDSFFVDGVAFQKTFSYAGFEQQPKSFKNAKICLLNLELELKAEKENAEVRVNKPEEYQAIIDAEWTLIYEKLEKITTSGANIVLSKLPIGDLATQYFADRDIFCAGRVPAEDLNRVAKATGGKIQSTVNGMSNAVLGECGTFEEVQLGAERFNIFKECPKSQTATIVLRGCAEQFLKEAERSLNDSIMVVRRAVKATSVVPGGGAIEMELSKALRHFARSISGRSQLIVNAFAKSLEIIPRCIAENAGLDTVEIITKLRQKHAQGNDGCNFGVDINSHNGIMNCYDAFIWEPLLIKRNCLVAATEAACSILSIDETVRNPKSDQEQKMKRPQGMPGLGSLGKRGMLSR